MAVFAWLLIFAGVFEFVAAFMVGNWAGFFLHLLIAILFIVVGVFMLTKPVMSAEAWTLAMSLFFLVGGLYLLISSLYYHLPGWGWQAFGGVISTILGFLIAAGWPATSFWIIGLFIGIELVCCGWAWIMLAVNLHKMQ